MRVADVGAAPAVNVRTVAGIAIGFVSWWALFLASTFLIVAVWPTSAALRQVVFEARDYSSLPTLMLLLFLVMYVPIGLIAGRITAAICRTRFPAWLVATPIFLYAMFQHLHVLWNNLPNWYNLAVVLIIAPFIVLGGRLERRSG